MLVPSMKVIAVATSNSKKIKGMLIFVTWKVTQVTTITVDKHDSSRPVARVGSTGFGQT